MTELRPLRAADIDIICHHRAEMFIEAGYDAALVHSLTPPFREWLAPRLTSGAYFGFMAESGVQVVGGIGLQVHEWAPHPLHPETPRRGYVLNVYVEREYRRKGLAGRLVAAAETEFVRRDVSMAVLHATEQGMPVYEGLGWARTKEMLKHF